MGRYLKNDKIRTAGYGAVMPFGPTSLRPTAPIPGDFRFNTDTTQVEVYYNSVWNSIAKVGSIDVVKDSFIGDSSSSIFGPISVSYTAGQEARMIVVVGNVFQNPGVAYTVSGNNITFTSPPPFGQAIIVLHGYAVTDTA